MRQSIRLVIPMIAVSALVAGCGSSSSSNTANTSTAKQGAATQSEVSSSAVVKTAQNSTLGKTVLVDAQGMTLYALSGEQDGKFICTGSACEGVWHPLTVQAGSTPSGSVSSLGVVKRPNGTTQITYNGMPLYSFAEDHAAGEANGQGVKDVGTWHAVTVTGQGGTASAPSTSSSSSSGESSSSSGESSSSGGSNSGGYSY